MNATVAAIYVYPVKSCRGLSLDEARLTERGLAHDREWMIVDADGRFITQREVPRLALVVPALSDEKLELSAPGVAPLAISLGHGSTRRTVTVWRDTLPAFDQGDTAAQWLTAWVGSPVRLVRFDPEYRRECNPAFAGPAGAHTGFADAYPLLVLSEASLADLNRRLDAPLPVNRFRPNLLLRGIEPYDEDYIRELSIGDATLTMVKPCTRCRITTTDQATAQVGAEPLATLARYRQSTVFDGVTFGMNAVVTNGAGGSIATGSPARCTLAF
jgi:uncharacterized protein